MRSYPLLDFIEKRIALRIYAAARELEKELDLDNFTAYYCRGTIVLWSVIFVIFVLATFVFCTFDALFYILLAASLGSFLVVLHHISYRCIVDGTGLIIRKFWRMEKKILWEDVKKVEIRKHEYWGKAPEKYAILRNKQNKIVFSCSYELVGFALIVRKSKREHR